MELRKLIKEEQKKGKALPRLIFINDLYDGKSVPVDVVKAIAYEWSKRWNRYGCDGLIPRFAGGNPEKLQRSRKRDSM